MRRWLLILAALMTALFVPYVALAQVTTPGAQYSFRVQARGEADVYETITSGRCRVLTAGTFNTDAPTIYTDATFATLATTLTATGYAPTIALDANGTCAFWAPSSVASVDVIIYIDSGSYAGLRSRVDGVTRQGIKQAHFDRGTPQRMLSIPFTTNATTQTSTTKIPAGAILTSANVEVTTAGTSVNFGAATPLTVTSFCNGQSTGTVGFFLCAGLNGSLNVQVGTAPLALTYSASGAGTGFLNIYYLQSGGN